MFRVHDYKTEITEKHTHQTSFFVVTLSVRSRSRKVGKRMKKERVEISTVSASLGSATTLIFSKIQAQV